MSTVEEMTSTTRWLTEFDTLVASAPGVLDGIPGAVYVCDSEGTLVRYNKEAAALWGREPALVQPFEFFCGSKTLYRLDGTLLPHAECPMAHAIRSGASTRNQEVVIERPDGSRIVALVNIRPLRGRRGEIEGAINCFQDISTHKAMEQEVERKRQDLEDFFENSAIGLHLVSADGIILRANKAELDLLGYSAEEYVGRHISEVHADAVVIGDILERLSCGEKLERYPARLRAKDGSIRHVLITSNSRVVDGKFVNTRCFTTDVSRLYEAEAARRESDDRLAATYEAATVGIAEVDAAGRFVRVNQALCDIFACTREQLLSRSFLELTSGEDRTEEATLYARQVSGDIGTYSIQKEIERADGSHAHVDVFSSTVRGQNGEFRYGVRVVQDVSERKRMQARIEQSERHSREVLDALPAALYTTDAEGRITFFNKAAVEMSGYVPELGKDQWCVTWRLYRPDGSRLQHADCPMAVSLKERRPIRGEQAIAERPDGTRVPFMAYPTPLRDATGALTGAVNMLVDMTEHKRAESRQRVLIDELNHRVKNTLATVQSLASQTARHTSTPGDFVPAFQARLLALARAHDLLTRQHWQSAAMDILVSEVTAPFTGHTGRVDIAGPAVELTPRIALSLTMALNELLTNAAKYGALSVAGGSLSICWTATDSGVEIEWSEQGGPQVIPPARRGFGTRLIGLCIERDLDGEVDLMYDPDGVRCRMTIPLPRRLVDG